MVVVSVFVVVKVQQVSVPYEPNESGCWQSGCADFEYNISFLIKNRFTVAHDENSSCKRYNTI